MQKNINQFIKSGYKSVQPGARYFTAALCSFYTITAIEISILVEVLEVVTFGKQFFENSYLVLNFSMIVR